MPAVSKRQYNFMQMMAHNPGKSKTGKGPSREVAQEFIDKTSKKKRSIFSKK